MLHIYSYMALGLAVTGLAAFAIYGFSVTLDADAAARILRGAVNYPARLGAEAYFTPLGYAVFSGPLKWPMILAPLGLVIGLSFGIDWLRPFTAQLMFWVYSALVGVSLGSIFIAYAHADVSRACFVAAAAFGIFSLWGFTTNHDVAAMESSWSWAYAVLSLPRSSISFCQARHCNGSRPGLAFWCSPD
jgi:FtsH-binding integral membrane protein